MPTSLAGAILDSFGLLRPAPAAPALVPPVLSWPAAVIGLVEGADTGAAGWVQTAAPHPRVAAFAGPEVTIRQLGVAVQPWLAAIASPSHSVSATDDVARAILAYDRVDLGVDSVITSNMAVSPACFSGWQVGQAVPLPIEFDPNAAVPQFVTDLAAWATLAATDRTAHDGLLDYLPQRLAIPDSRADVAAATSLLGTVTKPSGTDGESSEIIANTFLGQFADGILAADAAFAATPHGQQLPQTALTALNHLIDSTQWTVDPSGTSGDEHLALLLGHPVAVLRAAIKVDVQSVPTTSNARTTSVPVKLGTLAHTQDGLLAYFVADDYSSARAVDPAIGQVVRPAGSAITSSYVDLSPSFPVQPGPGVDLSLLATPATDVHATVGMLPQKSVGMRRDWVSAGLATLSPNWRYGVVLVDRKASRIPVAAGVHGTWSWHRRGADGNWVTDAIVDPNQTAIIPDDRMAVQYGWISLQLAPDPQLPGIPVQVSCITKPQPSNPRQRLRGLGGTNGDGGSPWWMTLDAVIAMVESGRFFYVLDKDGTTPNPIVVDVSASGNKFLRTVFDDTTSNNLLSPPQCPGQS